MQWKVSIIGALALSIAMGGCGGGGGTGTTPAPTAPPPGGGSTAHPDIVLLMVSGHDWSGGATPAYLNADAGPEIEDDLVSAGLTVETAYFVDDAFPVGGYGGYFDLVSALEHVRDTWAPLGSRVVVVAHSHGGVWAHAAIRDVPGLTITCCIDLDTNSYGWGLVGHDAEDALIGGDPRNRYSIPHLISYAAYPGAPSDATSDCDLEEVVWPNVVNSLEVRSGAYPPLALEMYDEKWNVRPSGSTDGLSGYYSGTSHSEVHQAGGSTLAAVESWLRARLGV